MLDDIIALISDLDNLKLTQEQKFAVIDALILVMYADGIVDLDEVRFLDRITERATWDDPAALAQHIATQRARVVAMGDDAAARRAYIDDARRRMRDPGVMKNIYLLCDKMANADRSVDEREMAVLDELLTAFSS